MTLPELPTITLNWEPFGTFVFPNHVCDKNLFPGECIICIDQPRPFVRINTYGGSVNVDVEILKVTPKRYKIRFLKDNPKGKRGDVTYVDHSVLFRVTIDNRKKSK